MTLWCFKNVLAKLERPGPESYPTHSFLKVFFVVPSWCSPVLPKKKGDFSQHSMWRVCERESKNAEMKAVTEIFSSLI